MGIYVEERPKNEINLDDNDSSDDVDPALARIRENTSKLNELTQQARKLSLNDNNSELKIVKSSKKVESKSVGEVVSRKHREKSSEKSSRDSKRNEVIARTEKREKERRFQKSLSIQRELEDTKDLLDEIERQNTDFERSSSFDEGNNAENVQRWIH